MLFACLPVPVAVVYFKLQLAFIWRVFGNHRYSYTQCLRRESKPGHCECEMVVLHTQSWSLVVQAAGVNECRQICTETFVRK
jgi:hypothetical protein